MIRMVYGNCAFESENLKAHVCVVTDHDGIESLLKEHGAKVVRVDDNVPSGSERISLAYTRFFESVGYDLVINVQGDEPLLTGDELLS